MKKLLFLLGLFTLMACDSSKEEENEGGKNNSNVEGQVDTSTTKTEPTTTKNTNQTNNEGEPEKTEETNQVFTPPSRRHTGTTNPTQYAFKNESSYNISVYITGGEQLVRLDPGACKVVPISVAQNVAMTNNKAQGKSSLALAYKTISTESTYSFCQTCKISPATKSNYHVIKGISTATLKVDSISKYPVSCN